MSGKNTADQTSHGQFVRLSETGRDTITIYLDGKKVEGLKGDTLLTVLLLNGAKLRHSEFGDGPRAGFCNMGACQDCWIKFEDGSRGRSCTTYAEDGMCLVSEDKRWPL